MSIRCLIGIHAYEEVQYREDKHCGYTTYKCRRCANEQTGTHTLNPNHKAPCGHPEGANECCMCWSMDEPI